MNQHIPLSNIINKLQRKELLLKLEYDYEKETFRQQTEAMGIGRKVKRGICWFIMMLFSIRIAKIIIIL
jgi:hypothetical protein